MLFASGFEDDNSGPAVTAKDSWIPLVISDKVESISDWETGPGFINNLIKVIICIIFWNIGSNKFKLLTCKNSFVNSIVSKERSIARLFLTLIRSG